MVTIVVGNKNQTSSTANIVTCCSDCDEPNYIQFDTNNLKKGEKPK